MNYICITSKYRLKCNIYIDSHISEQHIPLRENGASNDSNAGKNKITLLSVKFVFNNFIVLNDIIQKEH